MKMNEILKKRIEEAAERFVHLYPKLSVADVITSRRDAFIAGAIEALNSQWINVNEALPETDDWVIVMFDIGLMKVRKGIYVRINKPLAENLKITHWMPIPEFKTKEKEKAE